MANFDDTQEEIVNVLYSALEIADGWCRHEEYTYTFGDLLTLAKLIIDQQDKIKSANEG